MPGVEDEAVGIVLKLGSATIESAAAILKLLCRIATDARDRHRNYQTGEVQDGFVKRNVKRAANSALSTMAGHGDKGLVSIDKANADGKSHSYTIAEGVLTTADIDKLNREFALRNLQIGSIYDKNAVDADGKLGQVEFMVPPDQVEQFEAGLSRLVPQLGLGAAKVGEQQTAPAVTLDAAHVTENREDLRNMCDALNKNGISIAFSRDAEGHIELRVKPPKGSTYDEFTETLKASAMAYGLSEDQIDLDPIKRNESGGYPDKFTYQGMEFERDMNEPRTWVSHDPEDARTKVAISLGANDKPQFEISRNGQVIDSSKGAEIFYTKSQPLEDAVLGSMSALDRSKRVDEQKQAAELQEKRVKALSGSGQQYATSASSRTAEINAKAKAVARSAGKTQNLAAKSEERSSGVRR